MADSAPSPSPTSALEIALGQRLHEFRNSSGVQAQFLPTGALFALRQGEILINQLLPGPAEDGLLRLCLRWFDGPALVPAGSAALVGAGIPVAFDPHTVIWKTSADHGALESQVSFSLHPKRSAWAWHITLTNRGTTDRHVDFLQAQDLGLADEAAVRNNEAYVSQYLDLLPVADAQFGHVILARQNQPASRNRHPWLAAACVPGAVAYCTDGWQFFGADHRLTGMPSAVREPSLPSRRLQYEFALTGLQSPRFVLAPGDSAHVTFVAVFVEDHPEASSPADLKQLRDLMPLDWIPHAAQAAAATRAKSVFTTAPWSHGARPSSEDWSDWFPGERRHEERDSSGVLQSFFHGTASHVVSRDKEAVVARPHGHVMRSGDALWIDDEQFGVTCYAAGIFSAQAYLQNPNVARLLSVVRNHLGVTRASGQRVFIRGAQGWRQLGVPSAFVMEPGCVRWIYRLDDRTLDLRVWCSARESASFLSIDIVAGNPAEFLVTHQLAVGANEFEQAPQLEKTTGGTIVARPAAESFTSQHLPSLAFALAPAAVNDIAAFGGDELLYLDGTARHGPYATFVTTPVARCGFILCGTNGERTALDALVARARAEFLSATGPAVPPAAPARISGSRDLGVGRIDEILPWFTQNASIHFSAPHGLEQYGGAAWGVRDVTQGSVEWLLTAGEFDSARRALTTVFEQQYSPAAAEIGIAACWPQWFMFPPFRFIQATHSHGDVCFWPVKALCDYVEASNDFDFLRTPLAYTDPVTFASVGPAESLWQHCDRVIAHVESRFIAGTALVNYGDGDWDDTLQPADPAMRTRMVSAWTVALSYHTFRQLAEVSRRAGESDRAVRLEALIARIRTDFVKLAMPDGIVAGFLVHEANGDLRPLLHPRDKVTGIRYRLLPMTRSMLAELFTLEEAKRHATIIASDLSFADGVRLMSEPEVYRGGLEILFKRADTAANVGREIGLQYVHAHLRYLEAMAKLGDADRLWQALHVVNPVALDQSVPLAVPRQSNVYFSSSDADFDDRLEAAARWPELRAGTVRVRGGWRLYSSGPGLFLHKVRACLLGVRESFGDIVFDPVLPRSLDGLIAETHLLGRSVRLRYAVKTNTSAPLTISVNGKLLQKLAREPNPYRVGGFRVKAAALAAQFKPADNEIEITL